MLKRWLAFLAVLLLAGCAGQRTVPDFPQVESIWPLPVQLLVQVEQQQVEDYLLVIQEQHDGVRFSLFNPMGIPVARQVLQRGRWLAEGLLPPNQQAKQWFAAVLFALMESEQAARLYPEAQISELARALKDRWRVEYVSAEQFILYLDNQQKITVQYLQ